MSSFYFDPINNFQLIAFMHCDSGDLAKEDAESQHHQGLVS